jgi:pimeloyl-ACP methyl ester carboxylesterase
VPELSCPVLVTLGNFASTEERGQLTAQEGGQKTAVAASAAFLPDAAVQIARRCSFAELQQIDGVDHFGPFTQPARFASIICAWCDKVGARSRL